MNGLRLGGLWGAILMYGLPTGLAIVATLLVLATRSCRG
jgi:hypothetical protein